MSGRPNWKEQLAAFPVWLEDLRHGNHVPVTGWYTEFAEHFQGIDGVEVPKMHEGWAFKVWRKPKRPNIIPPYGFPIWICNTHGEEGDWYCDHGDLYQGRDGTLRDKLREGVTFLALYPPEVALLPSPEKSTEEGRSMFYEKPAWGAKELPPVGTLCEFVGYTPCSYDPSDKDLKEGAQVTIIAHFKDGESDIAAFTFNPGNPNRGVACVAQGMYGCFRPIRTPEQIAADERLHQIRNALSTIHAGRHFPNDLVRGNIVAATVEDMIDAGYHKD
jgi:hypothetical protein